MIVAAALLLAASLVRWGWELRRGPPLLPPDSVGVRDELLAATRRARAEAERRSRPLAEGERIDPNRAGPVELDRLPGVGPAVADRIVREREEGGAFRRPADLERVRGIGSATVERLAPLLDFDRAPPAELGAGRRGRRIGSEAGGRGPEIAGSAPEAPAGRPVTVPPPGGAAATPGSPSASPSPSSPPSRTTPPTAPTSGGGAPPTAGATDATDRATDASAAPVDLNRAGAAELQTLRGIGPALAERILELRRAKGRFRSVDELLEVRGIGPRTLERLRGRLRVGR